jgi:hypothetical protein
VCKPYVYDQIIYGEATSRHLSIFSLMTIFFSVFEYGICIHADIQPYMYDAFNWTLEWLPTISGSYATRISIQFLGGYQ